MARILLIEENARERELYATLLYYNGFEVEQAATAEAGMVAAEHRLPDLIMVDYVLPRVDGLNVAKLLKQNPVTARVPVVCFGDQAIPIATIRRAGADVYIRKPLSGDKLAAEIRALIGGQPNQAGIAEYAPRAVIIASKESRLGASLASCLLEAGYRVARAGDGASGLGTATTVRPDVILVDLKSPVLDGWAVLSRLKQDVDAVNIPVFAFTASPSSEEEQRALDAGFAAYLQNADREYVVDQLERHVRRP